MADGNERSTTLVTAWGSDAITVTTYTPSAPPDHVYVTIEPKAGTLALTAAEARQLAVALTDGADEIDRLRAAGGA